jgi:hypothetical protein
VVAKRESQQYLHKTSVLFHKIPVYKQPIEDLVQCFLVLFEVRPIQTELYLSNIRRQMTDWYYDDRSKYKISLIIKSMKIFKLSRLFVLRRKRKTAGSK